MLRVVAVAVAVSGGGQAVPVGNDARPPAPEVSTLPAPEGRTRAISGDTIEFQGAVFRLSGLVCPDPSTEAGQRAKALMNTLLRAPYVACAVTGAPGGVPLGRCTRDGRGVVPGTDFVVVMRRSGLCE